MTWAETNTESLKCQIRNKESVTIIAVVDAEGKKPPHCDQKGQNTAMPRWV
jgi:hypothetical protein